MTFFNANSRPLNANTGTVPDMSDTITEWFQPMIFNLVTKETTAFQDVETSDEINFMGVWQPLEAQKLDIKPEGQQAWTWFQVHAWPALILKPDQIIKYLGVEYRVMKKLDYTLYGYVEYHLVENYEDTIG